MSILIYIFIGLLVLVVISYFGLWEFAFDILCLLIESISNSSNNDSGGSGFGGGGSGGGGANDDF